MVLLDTTHISNFLYNYVTFNYLDYAPLLLICLPKNLHPKKTDTELSEAELRRRRVQIFDRKHDLRWYKSKLRGHFYLKMSKVNNINTLI